MIALRSDHNHCVFFSNMLFQYFSKGVFPNKGSHANLWEVGRNAVFHRNNLYFHQWASKKNNVSTKILVSCLEPLQPPLQTPESLTWTTVTSICPKCVTKRGVPHIPLLKSSCALGEPDYITNTKPVAVHFTDTTAADDPVPRQTWLRYEDVNTHRNR